LVVDWLELSGPGRAARGGAVGAAGNDTDFFRGLKACAGFAGIDRDFFTGGVDACAGGTGGGVEGSLEEWSSSSASFSG